MTYRFAHRAELETRNVLPTVLKSEKRVTLHTQIRLPLAKAPVQKATVCILQRTRMAKVYAL